MALSTGPQKIWSPATSRHLVPFPWILTWLCKFLEKSDISSLKALMILTDWQTDWHTTPSIYSLPLEGVKIHGSEYCNGLSAEKLIHHFQSVRNTFLSKTLPNRWRFQLLIKRNDQMTEKAEKIILNTDLRVGVGQKIMNLPRILRIICKGKYFCQKCLFFLHHLSENTLIFPYLSAT